MKPKILAFVGPSGCGKTTLVEHIKRELGIEAIVSYTTRPMREGEVNGVDHYFVSEADMPAKSEMLAYTKFGSYDYWTELSQIPKDICSYVIDEKGLIMLWEQFDSHFDIIPILIKRDIGLLENQIDKERLSRDKGRIKIEESAYRAVIYNNNSLEEFKESATQLIKNII